ncbi:hypothetical protein BH09PSE3_BH09PSE3_16000 [soil metagenome]
MALNSEIYLARAEECARDADNSSLPRVRDRNARAAEVWREMSEKAERFETLQGIAKEVKLASHTDSSLERKAGGFAQTNKTLRIDAEILGRISSNNYSRVLDHPREV